LRVKTVLSKLEKETYFILNLVILVEQGKVGDIYFKSITTQRGQFFKDCETKDM